MLREAGGLQGGANPRARGVRGWGPSSSSIPSRDPLADRLTGIPSGEHAAKAELGLPSQLSGRRGPRLLPRKPGPLAFRSYYGSRAVVRLPPTRHVGSTCYIPATHMRCPSYSLAINDAPVAIKKPRSGLRLGSVMRAARDLLKTWRGHGRVAQVWDLAKNNSGRR